MAGSHRPDGFIGRREPDLGPSRVWIGIRAPSAAVRSENETGP
jgi:hypothetical protein